MMRAAVLREWGSPLEVQDVADPVLGSGEVIVDVVSTRVLNYTAEVFSGERQYLLELPAIPGPGGIGRVREIGPDSTKLEVGELVFCDSTVRARDSATDPDITLQGWSARGEGGIRLQRHFKDGSFAEQMRVPTENVTPLGEAGAHDVSKWCVLGSMLVPYGGLLAARVTAGETIVVNGATGNFGGAGVAVALAMGAERVVATGRNPAALEALGQIHGDRVRPVQMSGNEHDDQSEIRRAAGRPIDCVLDLLPPAASGAQVRAALSTVRTNGRLVLMGGVTDDLDLSYNWVMRNCITIHGQWMYPRTAPTTMIAMVRAGLINLSAYNVAEFELDDVNAAVQHAAANAGPFNVTILRPNP